MFVCVCHALNDDDVEKAIANGSSSPDEVFEHYERKVRCKLCVPEIESKLNSYDNKLKIL